MEYESRTDIAGYSTPPDFFDEPVSEEELIQRRDEWMYDKLDDADWCQDVLFDSITPEQAKSLLTALIETRRGHDMSATFWVLGDSMRDVLNERYEDGEL